MVRWVHTSRPNKKLQETNYLHRRAWHSSVQARQFPRGHGVQRPWHSEIPSLMLLVSIPCACRSATDERHTLAAKCTANLPDAPLDRTACPGRPMPRRIRKIPACAPCLVRKIYQRYPVRLSCSVDGGPQTAAAHDSVLFHRYPILSRSTNVATIRQPIPCPGMPSI